jgi:hypothetical protein
MVQRASTGTVILLALHRSGLSGRLWGESPVPNEHDARELVAAHLERIARRGFSSSDEQVTALVEKQQREARKSIRPMKGLGGKEPEPRPDPGFVQKEPAKIGSENERALMRFRTRRSKDA